jgi:excisionase family DNA binding protein
LENINGFSVGFLRLWRSGDQFRKERAEEMTIEIPEITEIKRILNSLLEKMEAMSAKLDGGNWLTEDEAQDRMNCSRSTLWRLVQAGDLPVYKYGHKNQYKASDLDAYLNRKKCG